MTDPFLKVDNSKIKTQGSGLRARGLGLRAQGTGHRAQGTGVRGMITLDADLHPAYRFHVGFILLLNTDLDYL